jgi:colanic acid/amylovoran biosynthesis glycosyltransferase
MIDRRKRVLVWREELLPPSETFIANQATAMSRYEPVFAGVSAASGSRLLPREPALLLGAPGLRRRLELLRFRRNGHSRRLVDLIRQVDLVHAHFGPDGASVMAAARTAGKPLVVTFHGYDVTIKPECRQAWPMTKAWGQLVATAHALVAVSDFVGDRLVQLGAPATSIQHHYIGIPVPKDRSAAQRDGAVLFVGRLVEKKGCDLLLRAVAALPVDLRNVPVRIVGDGPLRGALARLAQDLGINTTFLGVQPPQVVDAEMWSASVFVGPSRVATNGDTEGLGMVFLEAAARRLPVITAAVGGTAEAVLDKKTGFVVEPEDSAAIATHLTQLLRQPRLARCMGDAGRRRVETDFDVEKQTAVLEDHYDRWLDG